MQAVGPKNPVLVTLKVLPGKKQAMIDLLNTPDGLQTTRDYDGSLSLEAFFNDETYTYYIYGDWASYEHYQKYLDWRFNDDESKMAQRVMALCEGGQQGLIPVFPNTDRSIRRQPPVAILITWSRFAVGMSFNKNGIHKVHAVITF